MDANVKLSESELLLVCDGQFILTKNNIINKVYLLFGELSAEFSAQLKGTGELLPSEVRKVSPKIYRGENYRGLPYVMLDYPRYYSKEDAFAIRCLFWWGNFFSITLHLAGMYAERYEQNITRTLRHDHSWFLSVNKEQWEHHFEEDNFLPVTNDLLDQRRLSPFEPVFIKIARRISLKDWDMAQEFFSVTYRDILYMFN